MSSKTRGDSRCDDCQGPIFNGEGPPDGWQLEDGRSICHECCGADLHRMAGRIRGSGDGNRVIRPVVPAWEKLK